MTFGSFSSGPTIRVWVKYEIPGKSMYIVCDDVGNIYIYGGDVYM